MMMTAECQQTRELLDSYLCAELLVETNHQILRHVSGCVGCRAELANRQRVRRLMKLTLACEPPPQDLVRRISEIPSGPQPGASATTRRRLPWHWSRRRGAAAARQHRRSVVPTWLRRALAGTAALTIVWLVFIPGGPARLTASELLARSDEATRVAANRPEFVLHRSLDLEERHGRSGPVVSRRRIEVWQDASSGIIFRRAFNEQNALIAGESFGHNGAHTLYRAGTPPKKSPGRPETARPTGLHKLDRDAAWRLDLSAAEYKSLLPFDAVPRLEDLGGHFLLRYESASSLRGARLVGATLKIRRDTLLPVEQTVAVEHAGEVREYAFSISRMEAVPRERIAKAVFEPDAVLLGAVDPPAARRIAPTAAPAVGVPPPVPPPSLDAELDVVYRLHRAEAWLQDSASVSRTASGNVRVTVAVITEGRRMQLLELLRPMASAGVSVEIRVQPGDVPAAAPPAPPSDLRAMALYEQLRQGFRDFIEQRLPASRRPSADERDQRVDGLVRSIAARSLDRSHGALRRAIVLEQTLRRFSAPREGQLSIDSEATLQSVLRDYARGIQSRLEALRLELQPILGLPWSHDAGQPHMTALPPDLGRTAAALTQLITRIDAAVVRSFGASGESASAPTLTDASFWRAITEGERFAASFNEPLPLGAR